MTPGDSFERDNDNPTWNHQHWRDFEDGGYLRLEEDYPGISEATALMHTEGHSSQEDIIHWLLAPVEKKYRWDRGGHLAGYELDGRTIYG